MSLIAEADPQSIARAAVLLREGKLVAFPTETVYGLGGDATADNAVAAIYEAKGRPHFNPLIIHVTEPAALGELIEWNDTARHLAAQFWPGPLTLVLPRAKHCPVSLLAGAGFPTLAVRIPSHPIARALLKEAGVPVAAPSANVSGRLSPTTPLHVAESLGDKVAMILAGGKSQVGLESTVVDLTSSPPRILRPGGVTKEQLEKSLNMKIETARVESDGNTALPAPGMLAKHYAPRLPLRMNADSADAGEALLAFGPDETVKGGAMRLNLSEKGDATEAAANLFAMLRELDRSDLTGIAVMKIPETGLGAAINDRLRRASLRD
ncbi:MAG TPA: L-threonylcarbamoyladenylate synthase [Alphaproteobacteria bacterium]|nr:L-threonylcarbamoyladenylate synthase [Alphaproteobacteria bacterium]